MVHFAGTLSLLGLEGKKPFYSVPVQRQTAQRLNTGIPKLGSVLPTLPTRTRPTLVHIPLGQKKILKGRFKDCLKKITNQNQTYKVKVHIWTETEPDLSPIDTPCSQT